MGKRLKRVKGKADREMGREGESRQSEKRMGGVRLNLDKSRRIPSAFWDLRRNLIFLFLMRRLGKLINFSGQMRLRMKLIAQKELIFLFQMAPSSLSVCLFVSLSVCLSLSLFLFCLLDCLSFPSILFQLFFCPSVFVYLIVCLSAVSYTHLTLPTKRIV